MCAWTSQLTCVRKAEQIVIEPLHPVHYDIDALVAGITDDNRHDPVDMGPPVGNEVW